jgi:hypothetical protein
MKVCYEKEDRNRAKAMKLGLFTIQIINAKGHQHTLQGVMAKEDEKTLWMAWNVLLGGQNKWSEKYPKVKE